MNRTLENGSILKIGIGILDEDIKRFKSQWNIQPKGLVELKYLTKMFYPDIQKLGAKNLAMKFLNVTLDKHWKISASDWEAEEFTLRSESCHFDRASNDEFSVEF